MTDTHETLIAQADGAKSRHDPDAGAAASDQERDGEGVMGPPRPWKTRLLQLCASQPLEMSKMQNLYLELEKMMLDQENDIKMNERERQERACSELETAWRKREESLQEQVYQLEKKVQVEREDRGKCDKFWSTYWQKQAFQLEKEVKKKKDEMVKLQESIWDQLRVQTLNQFTLTAEAGTQMQTPPNNGIPATNPAPAQEPEQRPALQISERPLPWRDTSNRSKGQTFSGKHWNQQRRGKGGREQADVQNRASGAAEGGKSKPPHNPAAKHRQKSGCNQQHCSPPPYYASPPPCFASHSPPFGGFPWPPHCWMMPPPPPPPWMRGSPPPPPPWAMKPWSAGKPRR